MFLLIFAAVALVGMAGGGAFAVSGRGGRWAESVSARVGARVSPNESRLWPVARAVGAVVGGDIGRAGKGRLVLGAVGVRGAGRGGLAYGRASLRRRWSEPGRAKRRVRWMKTPSGKAWVALGRALRLAGYAIGDTCSFLWYGTAGVVDGWRKGVASERARREAAALRNGRHHPPVPGVQLGKHRATDASTCECGSCVAQREAELSRWVRWAEWGDPAGSPAQTNGARPDGPAGTQQGGTATMTATGEVTSVADLLGQVDGLNTTLGEGGDQSVADGLAQAARIAEIADGADMHPGTAARDAVHAMSESAATAQDAVSAFLEALSAAVDAVSTGKGD